MYAVTIALTIMLWLWIALQEGVLITQWSYDMKMLWVSVAAITSFTILIKILRIYIAEVIIKKRYDVNINKQYEAAERKFYDNSL